MSKATTLALITTLANSMEDQAACSRYYDELIATIAKGRLLTWNVQVVEATPGTAVYTYPTAPTQVVELRAVFYNGHELKRATIDELAYVDPYWRDRTGEPICYVEEGETVKTYRLWPTPTDVRTTLATPNPLGSGFPDNDITIVYTELRSDLPAYFDLPLALVVMGREFLRESDHVHAALGRACQELGGGVLALLAAPR